jgi:intracellular sulfur oxidation DsrE/DsrF family protein
MKIARLNAIAFMLLVGCLAAMFGPAPAFADKDDPVFINLTSDDAHNMVMALRFSKHMSEAGHPATLFVNGKGVLMLNKNMSAAYGERQKELKELMAKGVTVIACGHCVEHLGLKEADLLDGVKIATPAIMNETLFKDDTKTLSW